MCDLWSSMNLLWCLQGISPIEISVLMNSRTYCALVIVLGAGEVKMS